MLVTMRSGRLGPAAAGAVERPEASRAAAINNDAILVTEYLVFSRYAATRNSVAGARQCMASGVRARVLSLVLPSVVALEWMRATDAKKSWGEPLNGWRRHFKEAKEPHVSEMRKEIRRHLTEGKRQAEMFASA
jgi:hypothetical protein